MSDKNALWILFGVILFGLVVIAFCDGGQPAQAPPVCVPVQAPEVEQGEWNEYRKVMAAAKASQEPVVVYVRVYRHEYSLPDSVWQLPMSEFPGVANKAIVVGRPNGTDHDRIDLPWNATTEQIRAATVKGRLTVQPVVKYSLTTPVIRNYRTTQPMNFFPQPVAYNPAACST